MEGISNIENTVRCSFNLTLSGAANGIRLDWNQDTIKTIHPNLKTAQRFLHRLFEITTPPPSLHPPICLGR